MPSLIPDFETLEKRLARLPLVMHRAREVVLTAGSKTGELLFLRSGAVEIVKDGIQIGSVSEPGSVFGELAVLLDQAHTADVRTLEQSEFYVANAQATLTVNPTVALYVAIDVAFRGKADMAFCTAHVCFGPKADISRVNAMSALPPRTFGSATQMSAKGQSDGSSARNDAQIRSRAYVGKSWQCALNH